MSPAESAFILDEGRPHRHTLWDEAKLLAWELLQYPLDRAGTCFRRDVDHVARQFETAYDITLEQWVRNVSSGRLAQRFRDRLFHVNSWFRGALYNRLLSGVIVQFGARSALEVGCGVGMNLTGLALKDDSLMLTGLDYSHNGIVRGRELLSRPPADLVRMAGQEGAERKDLQRRVRLVQGSAFDIPFPDKSFDLSFTVNVLEQMPHRYKDALREMCRVSRGHCLFIESFRECNSLAQRFHLRRMDYFRFSHRTFEPLGLKPLGFFTDFPQKLSHRAGLLICAVAC